MKTNLLWLLALATQLLTAQNQVDTQWANDVNTVFANLDKNKVPHGVLLDYAMEFIDVPTYNGVVTTSSGPFTSTSENYVDVMTIQ
jgi:hypothetical protein